LWERSVRQLILKMIKWIPAKNVFSTFARLWRYWLPCGTIDSRWDTLWCDEIFKKQKFCNVDCGTSIFENGDLSDNYKKTKQNIYFCILGEVSFIIFRTHISSCMFCNIYTIGSCLNLDFNNDFIFWEHVLKLVLRAGRAPQKYTCEQKPHEN